MKLFRVNILANNLKTARRKVPMFFLALACMASLPNFAKESTYRVDKDGTIHTANGVLPVSALISPEAQEAMRKKLFKNQHAGIMSSYAACGLVDALKDRGDRVKVLKARQCLLKKYDYPQRIAKLRTIYDVTVETTTINGIEVDVVTPKSGVPKNNKERVLLYFHGSGGFIDHPDMRKTGAIPAAAIGKVKVIGVDHRLAPEGTLADTLEDLTAAYRGVLKEYPAENVGFFGCSAGGYFSIRMIPYLHKQGLPLPGAIAPQGETGDFVEGDSAYTDGAFGGSPLSDSFVFDQTVLDQLPRFAGFDINDPVVTPTRLDSTMQLFPPTIIMNSLRDLTHSRAVSDHRALLRNKVDAELHLWEGLPHCFQNGFPEIPETTDFWQQMNTFFDKHLGSNPLAKQ